jgi:hypothetical protein
MKTAMEKMTDVDKSIEIARSAYEAYVKKDRAAIEKLIAADFHFTSPLDNRIDRATYFARCWPVRKGQIVEVEVYFGWSIPHEAKPGGFISGPDDDRN